jgi:hypothetical protein
VVDTDTEVRRTVVKEIQLPAVKRGISVVETDTAVRRNSSEGDRYCVRISSSKEKSYCNNEDL